MRSFLRQHAETLAVLLGVLAMFVALVVIIVYVNEKSATQGRKERTQQEEAHQRAERVVLAGELKAEQIVTRSNREACTRGSHESVYSLNTWYYVDRADFQSARNPEATPKGAQIRLVEAQGIEREQLHIAALVDFHNAHELLSPVWRAAANRAHFSCVLAFPVP